MGSTSDPRSGAKSEGAGAGAAPGGVGTGTAGDPANAPGAGTAAPRQTTPAANAPATPTPAAGDRGRANAALPNTGTTDNRPVVSPVPTSSPAPGGVEEADRAAEHAKGRKGPKNPPANVMGGVEPSGKPGDEPQATLRRPEPVKDRDGRDITPGYAGPKLGAPGFVASSNFDHEPPPAPDPPVLPAPKTPADPRPGDYKPGHSGGVPTPPYTEEQAKQVMPAGEATKETE